MRATAGALLGLVTSSLGFGLGPTTTGLLSDLFAARAFAGPGTFDALCPGGLAPAAAAATLKSSCLAASATGSQDAIIIASFVYVLAGFLFGLSARTLREDLAAAADPNRVWA
jgi:hypothetical protein